jgi:uncharacterized protein
LTSALRIALLALCLIGAVWIATRQSGPGPNDIAAGLVDDAAELMTPEQRAFVAEYHDHLLADHDIDYRVVTATDTDDINLYSVRRFEALAGQSRSETGRALLLVVDPEQDLVRLEVSFALEGVFPDAFVAYVEQRQMVPFFRDERVADGILATTELIITRAQRAAADAGFDGEAWTTGSGGAGATAKANIGAGAEAARPASVQAVSPGRTPETTLKAYFAAMQTHDRSPDLAIYTAATRDMLRQWTMTPAQMDNVVRTYRRCHAEPARTGPDGRGAVIRYPIKERACAPWFFQRIGPDWQLDLTMMQRAIRFGRSNAWRFDMAVEHAYRFAFTDWTFDRHGFPKRRR